MWTLTIEPACALRAYGLPVESLDYVRMQFDWIEPGEDGTFCYFFISGFIPPKSSRSKVSWGQINVGNASILCAS